MIRDEGIPFKGPRGHELDDRLRAVLQVVYLIFNEGYFASSGGQLVREELASKAIELGQVLVQLMPDEPEARGLLALMLFHHSRRDARSSQDGELVLLADQDRALWDDEMIRVARGHLARAAGFGPPGPYLLQAQIAAEHAVPFEDTDWSRVADLYDQLACTPPSPCLLLHPAVTLGHSPGPHHALYAIQHLHEQLSGYHPFHTARSHFLAEVGRKEEAKRALSSALEMMADGPEKRLLENRLTGLSG